MFFFFIFTLVFPPSVSSPAVPVKAADRCLSFSRVTGHAYFTSSDVIIATETTTTIPNCLHTCLGLADCVAVAYDDVTNTCLLGNKTAHSVSSTNYIFYIAD